MKQNQTIHLHLVDVVTFVLEAFEIHLFPFRQLNTKGNDLPSLFMVRDLAKVTLSLQGLDYIHWHHPI